MDRIAIKTFSLLDQFDRLTTGERIADAVLSIFKQFGFNTLLISAAPNLRQRLDEVILAKKMPAEWIKLYSDRRYADTDPVMRHLKQSWKPFEWNEVTWNPEHNLGAEEVMQMRKEFGFHNALVVPIFNAAGLAGFVSASGAKIEVNAPIKGAFHLLAVYAFHRARSLRREGSAEKPTLTQREREVLTWVANGKSAWEIGEILRIAKRTVDEHVQTIFQKLDARSRPNAVAIAIQKGLIQL
jgi:LuxR family quorum sensing-dependent transcriptional regulator